MRKVARVCPTDRNVADVQRRLTTIRQLNGQGRAAVHRLRPKGQLGRTELRNRIDDIARQPDVLRSANRIIRQVQRCRQCAVPSALALKVTSMMQLLPAFNGLPQWLTAEFSVVYANRIEFLRTTGTFVTGKRSLLPQQAIRENHRQSSWALRQIGKCMSSSETNLDITDRHPLRIILAWSGLPFRIPAAATRVSVLESSFSLLQWMQCGCLVATNILFL